MRARQSLRAREIQATAETAGRTRTAELNPRLATGVEHLITRITADEQEELQQATSKTDRHR